jgi:ferredoxin
MPKVTFLPADITLDLPAGSSLLEGASLAGIFIETPCGGKGSCQKCLVRISAGDKVYNALICQTSVPDESMTVELQAFNQEGQFEKFEDPAKHLAENRTT